MPMHRIGIHTRVLPTSSESISFKEDAFKGDARLETCTPVISADETLSSLRAAAFHLVDNLQLVAMPTETVYGLAAIASSPAAVQRIFEAKNRPADNPLIVHISSISMLRDRVLFPNFNIPQTYKNLIQAFWPGPLTLLFPADPSKVPDIVTAGHKTVAVRMPGHRVSRALIALADTPLAAPSANSSGRPSPTRAAHVFHDMSGKIAIILDDGASSNIGLESTVVDGLNEDGHLRVLRPGGVTVEDLERVMEKQEGAPVKVLVHGRDYSDEVQDLAPTTPGMKYRHYAPTIPVTLLVEAVNDKNNSHPHEDISSFITSLIAAFPSSQFIITIGLLLTSDSHLLDLLTSTIARNPTPKRVKVKIYTLGTRETPSVTAQRLFDGLLTLERDGADAIVVESIEETNEGLAIMNRVRKAAGETRWITTTK